MMKKQIFALIGGIILLNLALTVNVWAKSPKSEDFTKLTGSLKNQTVKGEIRLLKNESGFVRFVGSPPSSPFKVGQIHKKPEDLAHSFLKENAAVFGLENPRISLETRRVKSNPKYTFVRFRQVYDNVPVWGAEINVQTENSDSINSVLSRIMTETDALDSGKLKTRPKITAAEASSAAIAFLSAQFGDIELKAAEPNLMLYEPSLVGNSGRTRLVWATTVRDNSGGVVNEYVLVDAHTGEIALHFTLIMEALNRQVYDAVNTTANPGTLRRSEGQPASGITDVDLDYTYMGDTYNFYSVQHGRDSIDGQGYILSSTVRFCHPLMGCPMQNAFWNGSRTYFGEGFCADDVVGHELTHGVTQYESDLIYYGQSGAINESFSDIWGEFVDLTNGSGNDTPAVRWEMGEDTNIGAIRDMANPPRFGDPDRLNSPLFYRGTWDNGGVHINSGVGNKLAYLLTDGGTFNGRTVTGMGIDKVAALFYEVQTNILISSADYYDLGAAIRQAAINLNFTDSEINNVISASKAVEISLFSGGTGTSDDPYLISDALDLVQLGSRSYFWNKYFRQIADIDLSAYAGTSFNVIGDDANAFTGVFDGNSHTISNLTYTSSTGRDYAGLFGYIGAGGLVKNVKLSDVKINAGNGYYIGGLAGANDGIIENCSIVGGSVEGDSYTGSLVGYDGNTVTNCSADVNVSGVDSIGGLVGANDSGATITESFAEGSVTGDTFVGGLVGGNYGTIRNSFASNLVWGISGAGGLTGDNYNGTITKSYAFGNVSGAILVGGLAGFNDYSQVTDCYAHGSASGDSMVGGLVGENHYGSRITRCYSVGHVTANSNVGGLVGKNFAVVDPNCFWDKQTSGRVSSAGGTGKTTAEMKTQSTFTGWDFVNTWKIQNAITYPYYIWQGYAGGGTPEDPYRVYTTADMNTIGTDSNDWDKHFKLVNDIDLSGYTGTKFHIIGSESKAFTGVFDGNNLTISNFTYTTDDANCTGLFGHLGPGGEIKNLHLNDIDVEAADGTYIGGLAAWNEGTIKKCSVSGSITGNSADEIGGLAGWNDGSVTDCFANVNISGDSYLGGLAGVNGGGTITRCQAIGSVSGGGELGGLVGWSDGAITESSASGHITGSSYLGGLVGYGFMDTVTNCYATGAVGSSGNSKVGGLVGRSFSGIITKCYSTGAVSGTTDKGGLVGKNTAVGNVIASFWDKQTSGQSSSAGGISRTTAQMKTKSTFTGWDFTSIWSIDEGADYPRLRAGAELGTTGSTTLLDFTVLAGQWMQTVCDESNGYCNGADRDRSGAVDVLDLKMLAENWLR
jgi:Zn-dependent metalloprotease